MLVVPSMSAVSTVRTRTACVVRCVLIRRKLRVVLGMVHMRLLLDSLTPGIFRFGVWTVVVMALVVAHNSPCSLRPGRVRLSSRAEACRETLGAQG